MSYKITRLTGRIYDAQGVEVPRDDRDEKFLAYVLWLSGDRAPEVIDEPPEALTPEQELEAAQAWGQALVRGFEAAALAAGINANPSAALALDRYLREVSAALVAGRLHVAYAALAELLATPQGERPAGAQDAALVLIHDALAERLALPLWGA